MGEIQELEFGVGDNPGVLRDLFFELALGPPGVSREGFHEGVGLIEVGLGLVDGDAGFRVEAAVMFVKGGEGELIAGNGTSKMDRKLPQFEEVGIADEVAHGPAGGVIENQSKGSFFRGVIGEKDNGFMKRAIAQRRVGEEELFTKFGEIRLGIHSGKMTAEWKRVKTLIRAIGSHEWDLGKDVTVNLYYGLIIRPDLGRFAAHE